MRGKDMHRLNRQSNCLFPLKKIRSIFKMERIFLYKKISDSFSLQGKSQMWHLLVPPSYSSVHLIEKRKAF